jgi:hypothetical protein
MRTIRILCCFAVLSAPTFAVAAPVDLDPGDLLAQIKKVGREGEGSPAAAAAWRLLTALGPANLPDILIAMDDADPIGANWLRTAADAVGERTLREKSLLPAKELEAFLMDHKHAPAARRLAYEWLARVDATVPARFLPDMLQDPSAELRRDAVALQLDKARALRDRDDKPAAIAAYTRALSGACDDDQVKEIAAALEKLGSPVDLAAHFGFVREWRLAAAFDNTAGSQFKTAYPPEKGVDFTAAYKGKNGADVAWKEYAAKDPYGLIDLNKAIGKEKGVVAYACALIDSPMDRPVQVRVGSYNALKIFLNGKEIFARDEYHHGMRIDQHIVDGVLKAGRNELLLKVCQNEQSEPWAQNWIFQARLTDSVGAAVPWTPGKP